MLTRFFESRFFEGLGKAVDILILSIYFVICSIPIFTIGASLTALYYSIHKVIFQGRGYTTEFFHSFKDNFKQATLSWLIFLVVGTVLGGDLYITTKVISPDDKMAGIWIIFLIFLLIEVIWVLYHFIYIGRFENGFKQSFKVSGALAVLHFAYSILLLLITAMFVLWGYLMPVFALFIPALYMTAIHPLMEKIFRGYMSEEDLALEDERLGQYHVKKEEEEASEEK